MGEPANGFYGVILAAGEGARLRPLSFNQPKPMLPICNKSIIQHQIEYMLSIGIRRFLIVVGHLGRHIMEAFGNGSQYGAHIRYVIQEKPLGIAHAVYQLEDEVDGPFLLFLGDIFLVPKQLDEMFQIFRQRNATAVLAVKREEQLEYIKRNFAVSVSDSGRVNKVVEKPRYVKDNLKGCGIYLFDQPIFDAIRRTPRTAMRDEYEITTSIQILIDDGLPVYPAEVVAWDMNVTIPADLLECNLRLLDHMNLANLIGESVDIPSGAHISRTIIGDNVRIKNPINISRSLITSGSIVDSSRDLDGVIISASEIIQCFPEKFDLTGKIS
jgi:NDP-sugar pyrophosphorylase family protein